jgi:hypothetical protein
MDQSSPITPPREHFLDGTVAALVLDHAACYKVRNSRVATIRSFGSRVRVTSLCDLF